MTYTLSKILVGSMGGSDGLFARGASQKKWASSAQRLPPIFFAFSISVFTVSESGFAGAAGGAWAQTRPAEIMAKAIAFFMHPRLSESLRLRDRESVYRLGPLHPRRARIFG